jgi:hypothetical protein
MFHHNFGKIRGPKDKNPSTVLFGRSIVNSTRGPAFQKPEW